MKIYPLRLIPQNTSYDFIKLGIPACVLSLLLSLITISYVIYCGFNLGIDFAGGVSIEIRSDAPVEVSRMRSVLNKLDIGEVVIQSFGDSRDIGLRIGTSGQKDLSHNVSLIKSTLLNELPYKLDYRKVDLVGPQIGDNLIASGTSALLLSFLAIMIYIWIRFEWYFGVGVLIALMHDAILSLGFMSFTRLDFNLSTIAAILTVIGYSVNDSVVIYDRIRENLRKYGKKEISQIINISVNETLSRTTLTVLTTLLAALSLIIYGGEAINSFSILVFFGILIGTYSSIFISAPILIFLKKFRPRLKS
jgi:preprotein translocase subunit SecF